MGISSTGFAIKQHAAPIPIMSVATWYMQLPPQMWADIMQQGSMLSKGTNQLVCAAAFSSESYSKLGVYTQSSLAEQTTPAWGHLSDLSSTVAGL